MLDLRKLAHLVAVADAGGFTRAAERLHLSQQALSASVRALEREVGVPLLDRSGNTVGVLPAGEALIADARLLRAAASSALRRARRIGRGEADVLRIGHTPAVTGEEVTALLARARRENPQLATEVSQRYPHELTAALLGDELDLGLGRAMRPARGLVRAALTRHRLRAAVDAGHRLAGRAVLRLDELAAERIVVWGEPGHSGYTDLLAEHCRNAGFEPRLHRNPVQGTPPVTAVLGTGDVAFVTAAPGPAAGGQVQVLELEPPVFAPVHAYWPQHTAGPARERLLAALGAGPGT